jgi:hypothetical protein
VGGIDYVRAHLEESLATDGRVAELGLHVHVDGEELVVSGGVSTPERRDAVTTIAREVVPEFRVRNETMLVALDEPDEEEPVA